MNTKQDIDDVSLLSIMIDENTEIFIQPIGNNLQYGKASSVIKNLDKVLNGIKTFSRQIKEVIKDAEPDEFKVEFSVGFSLKSSELIAVIANADVNSALKVTITWKK